MPVATFQNSDRRAAELCQAYRAMESRRGGTRHGRRIVEACLGSGGDGRLRSWRCSRVCWAIGIGGRAGRHCGGGMGDGMEELERRALRRSVNRKTQGSWWDGYVLSCRRFQAASISGVGSPVYLSWSGGRVAVKSRTSYFTVSTSGAAR
jgi:hypothetical protein